NVAPSPARSTAAWIEAPGSTAIALGGQAALATPGKPVTTAGIASNICTASSEAFARSIGVTTAPGRCAHSASAAPTSIHTKQVLAWGTLGTPKGSVGRCNFRIPHIDP